MHVKVIAEIGINHNGSLETALELIDAATMAGCDFVKFQKRTVDKVYTAEELARPRESVFGKTNGDLKHGLEFGSEAYERIDKHCKERGIGWFASCWDVDSVDFIECFTPPCYKIASPCLTDHALLRKHKATRRPLILSTGMSMLHEIDEAVEVLDGADLTLLHCTSTYPCPVEELNLNCIPELGERYDLRIGYSGHETGLATTVVAVALGATMIERHLTLCRTMQGTDHSASVEPHGMKKLVDYIRAVELALGDGEKKLYKSELPARDKLRKAL